MPLARCQHIRDNRRLFRGTGCNRQTNPVDLSIYWALGLTMAGAIPVLLFAALIFEPTSPERYLPALPFLIVAVAWCLRDLPWTHRTPQLCIAGFLACMFLTNIYFMNRRRIDREDAVELVRVSAVEARHNEQDLIGIITIQDALRTALNRELFSPVNRPIPLRVYEIIRLGTPSLRAWRQEFRDHANTGVGTRGGGVGPQARLAAEAGAGVELGGE